ncbi:hypothetical protein GGI35DRAFT_99041 [Trichoderma velutinum]
MSAKVRTSYCIVGDLFRRFCFFVCCRYSTLRLTYWGSGCYILQAWVSACILFLSFSLSLSFTLFYVRRGNLPGVFACLVLQSRHFLLSGSGIFLWLCAPRLSSFHIQLWHDLFEIVSWDGRPHGHCMYLCGFFLMSLIISSVYRAFPCLFNGHESRTKCISKKRKISYVPFFSMLLMLLRTKYYHDCLGFCEALNEYIRLSLFRRPRTA